MAQINVATEFSSVPAGRFISDGPYSGEAFRETLLWPALKDGKRATIVMDGSEGYGSSFLEEAFGGLIRLGYISKDELHERLTVVSDDASLALEIWEYIDAAVPQTEAKSPSA